VSLGKSLGKSKTLRLV